MDRPILFSAPMVRAILDGKKTMTRRIYKPRFDKWQVGDCLWVRETYLDFIPDDDEGLSLLNKPIIAYRADWNNPNTIFAQNVISDGQESVRDYGRSSTESEGIIHAWKPSIFMPRRLSRILLELTELKRERLQDISESDAIREGVCQESDCAEDCPTYKNGFKHIFQAINGREIWEQNPKVVAIGFKVLEVRNDK